MKHDTHPTQLCGPDCRYRGLYEGSQRSLTDLAARQADALGRLGRLRVSISRSLKRFFPTEFAEAERGLDSRLSDVDDDLLAGYLEAFLQLATAKAPASASDVARLRAGLMDLGVTVTGAFTVTDLATALERHHASSAPLDLDAVFSTTPWINPAEHMPVVASPRTPPSPPRSSTPHPAPPSLDDIPFFDENYDEGYDDFLPPATSAPSSLPSRAAPVEAPVAPEAVREDLPAPTAPHSDVEAPVASLDPSSTSVQPDPSLTSLDDLFSPASPLVPIPRRSRPKPDTVPGPWSASPLKPQNLPTPTKAKTRTVRRTTRTSAQAPTPPPAGLDDAVRAQLLAAVCVPRPVFVADLNDLVQSAEVVTAWTEEWAADPDLQIRFISPKSRHKMRGALIFPQEYLRNASEEFKKSLWAQVITNYNGAKAYELGVLLHRYNENVISYDLGPHVVLLRLSLPQGLVGVLCVLDTSLGAGGATRNAICDAVETLLRERLVQIAVLTTNAELTDTLAEVIAEEATARHWAPTSPVTLSRSWDYANSTGVAIPLLGT